MVQDDKEKSIDERLEKVNAYIKSNSNNSAYIRQRERRARELSELSTEDLLRQFTI